MIGRSVLFLWAAVFLLIAPGAHARISDDVVKIGVLTDMAGVYSDMRGPGSVAAARMALEDFGPTVAGVPIEIVAADHQNKADVAATRARAWYDAEGVDVIVGLVNSSTALAVHEVGRQLNRVSIGSGAATSRLTNEDCSPVGFHWAYDTYAVAVSTAKAILEEGGDSWYFLTVDYAFGHALEDDVRRVVNENGGTVLGGVHHPFPTTDFSSFLLQAQASGAKVIALANAGQDTVTSIKQAHEFGITDIRRGDPCVGGPLLRTCRAASVHEPRRDLFLGASLFEGGRGRAVGRRADGHCPNEGASDRGFLRAQRLSSRRRPDGP
jgi:branched-chain amino acid transport system substrate-binding protein